VIIDDDDDDDDDDSTIKNMSFGLHYPGLFPEVGLYLFTNISGRCIGPIFKNQAIHVGGTNRYYRNAGTNNVYRNVGNPLPTYAAKHPKLAKTPVTPLFRYKTS
jgi:hypothetical protein